MIALRGGIGLEQARAAVERGGAFLRGRRVKDPAAAVAAGDPIEVQLRDAPDAGAAGQPLDEARLLHLDDLVAAVDKPAGVLAQEGRSGGPSLPDLVSDLLRRRGCDPTALLVHRLDRGTTGCTLLARTRAAQAALLAAFREGRVRKEYRAWVQGEPAGDAFEVELALGADPAVPGRRRPDPRGEPARTRFQVLRRAEGRSLLAAFPETGRTHQIRVHLAARGLPLLGDARYGGPRALTFADGARIELARPLLHALSLEAPHPSGGGILSVRAPVPADFAALGGAGP